MKLDNKTLSIQARTQLYKYTYALLALQLHWNTKYNTWLQYSTRVLYRLSKNPTMQNGEEVEGARSFSWTIGAQCRQNM